LATYTLRQLLISQPQIDLGDVTLSAFRNDGPTTVGAQFILIDTVEGANPGINVYLDPRVATTTLPTQVGFLFEASTTGSNLVGASMRLDGYSFAAPESGGQVSVGLTQAPRPVENIGINLLLDNAPGAPDVRTGSDDINGGPVPRFTFEYDSALNVPGTVGVTQIRFDVLGGASGLPAGFDGLQYIGSYGDLIGAFGANRVAGEQHYLSSGQAEGRQADLFGETQYLKNYGDLQGAFVRDVNAATAHFITSGASEGRVDDAASPAQIDGLQYIASNADLITAFGANAAAGQQHYVGNGVNEGRVLDNFNETQYLANYGDLQVAFGGDTEAATAHYIASGFAEGRNDFLL
jgi:hypothetical protein